MSRWDTTHVENFLVGKEPAFRALCAMMVSFWWPDEFEEFEDVLARWDSYVSALHTESCWKDGGHAGDCTKACMTCMRCTVEGAVEEALELLENWK